MGRFGLIFDSNNLDYSFLCTDTKDKQCSHKCNSLTNRPELKTKMANAAFLSDLVKETNAL